MTEPENEARLRPLPGNGKHRCRGPGASDSSERRKLFLKPVNEFGAAHETGGGFEHQALLFVQRSVDVASVQREEGHLTQMYTFSATQQASAFLNAGIAEDSDPLSCAPNFP